MDKHFKYQISSLNIIILNVRSHVLFSICIDVVLKLQYLLLNYSIYVTLNICISLVVVVNTDMITIYL